MTRVIFMGTPEFAVPSLQILMDSPGFELVGVVTQPDRPAGRGKEIQVPPIKQTAVPAHIQVIQPNKLRDPGVFEQLQAWRPDLIVVAAFGQILRQNVLDLPRFGCINVHASLLPRWRGATPIQAAIRAGDTQTGITIMKMDAGLDTGTMLSQRVVPITPTDTGQTLHDKLAAAGGPLLIETLIPYLDGTLLPQPQPQGDHGYAPMLKKEDGLIDWTQSAVAIDRQVRAFDPWPGTYTTWEDKTLKVLSGKPLAGRSAPPGIVMRLEDGSIVVGTGEGVYILGSVQLAGKPATPIAAFVNGYGSFIGAQLGIAPQSAEENT